MNKIAQTIYGSKIPLNERGLLNILIPSVKGKAGTSIGASTSPLGFSISVVKFVPLVQGIDLSDEKVRQSIKWSHLYWKCICRNWVIGQNELVFNPKDKLDTN